MKCNTIKTGAMLGLARVSAGPGNNAPAELPDDFGKIREQENGRNRQRATLALRREAHH